MRIPCRIITSLVCFTALANLRADLLVTNLSPATAVYSGGVISTPASGVLPAVLAQGHSFNIEFTPKQDDLSGTVLLMETGGTVNGTGLYLIDGVVTYVTKHGSADAQYPTGLNDTALPSAAVTNSFGRLTAGVRSTAAASWNNAGQLILAVQAGTAGTRDEITLTGTFGNWAGDRSFSVGQNPRPGGGGMNGSLGGLAGETALNEFGPPFDVETDNDSPLVKSLSGPVHRAFYWNAIGQIGAGMAAIPAFDPKTGSYAAARKVTITSDPGATIFYTTDGSTPTAASTSGASPLTLTVPASMTLKAYASRPGAADSPVETADYVVEAPVLRHRYSFDGAAGTTAINDSVGSAHGTLMNGSDTAALGNGKLTLDGNFSSGYVELPAGLISALTNVTFTSWITWDGGNSWQRIFDFGTNSAVGQNVISVYATPRGGPVGVLRWGFNAGGEQDVDADTQLVTNKEVCVTVTFSYPEETGTLYVDGRKVSSGRVAKELFNVPDVYNWLGRAKYNDPYYAGSYNEFRIYSGAQNDFQVAAAVAAGPDRIVTDPGAFQSLAVAASATTLDAQGAGVPLQVLATFANITNVDVTLLPETAVGSSDQTVVTVVDGTIVPMGVGTAVLSATYGGKSGSLSVKVTDSSPWPALLHRYSFSDPQGTTVADSVGAINGTFHGVGTFTGSQLLLPINNPKPDTNGVPDPAGGWVSFPSGQGLIGGLPAKASLECWVVWNGGGIWQEVYDFGQAATPGVSLGGGTYVMLCSKDNIGRLRLQWYPVGGLILLGPALQVGEMSHVVLTHDEALQLDKLYVNGKLVASGANPLLWSSLPDTDNWLARDQWRDPMFNGAYDEFRIWNGALTAGQVANLYSAGPNVIAGPLLKVLPSGSSISLQWPANATGFKLQSISDLKAGVWSDVSGTPVVTDGFNSLSLTVEPTAHYYRLKQ